MGFRITTSRRACMMLNVGVVFLIWSVHGSKYSLSREYQARILVEKRIQKLFITRLQKLKVIKLSKAGTSATWTQKLGKIDYSNIDRWEALDIMKRLEAQDIEVRRIKKEGCDDGLFTGNPETREQFVTDCDQFLRA